MSDQCKKMQDYISEMFTRELTADERNMIDRHLQECDECRHYQDALQSDDHLLSAFAQSMDDTVQRLEGRIMESIESMEYNATEGAAPGRNLYDLLRSRMLRFAAAAIVVAAIIFSVSLMNRNPGSALVWAEVITRVENAQDYICRISREMNIGDDLDMVQYCSAKYGIRQDIYNQGYLGAVNYVVPQEKKFYTVIHRDKRYFTMEMTDDELDKLKRQSDAQGMIAHFKTREYEELGTRKIDGRDAEGIKVHDAPLFLGTVDSGVIRLWVDKKTGWPVRMEMQVTAQQGKIKIKADYTDFQWNPSLSAEDFAVDIPEDYQSMGEAEAVQRTEQGMIAGLRYYAGLMRGGFPSELVLVTAIEELTSALQRSGRMGEFKNKGMGEFMKIRSACEFYGMLLQEEKDPAYSGASVTITDYDKVLVRWRLDDGRYRVVYGDLRAETVDAARLTELESNQ